MEIINLYDLVNKDIAGEISPEEKKILEDELVDNKMAQVLNEKLHELTKGLDENTKKRNLRGWKEFFAAGFSAEKGRPILFFLVGAVLTAFVAGIFNAQFTNLSRNEAAGTMTNFETYGNFKKGNEISTENSAFRANITSQYSADMIMVQVEVSSPEEIKMEFNIRGSNLSLYGNKILTRNNVGQIISTLDYVQIINKGDNKYLLLFKNEKRNNERINIQVFSGSQLVFDNSLTTN